MLTHVPRSDVTITITPDNQLSASATTLTFTTSNWNIPQTISVSAIQDGIAEGKHSGTITHTVTSSDTRYNGIAVNKLTAAITDAAAPTVKLPFASGTIWTQPNLSLSGTAAPGVTVTLTLTNLSTGEVRAVSAVTDANGNWNVTLTGLTDGNYELQPEADGVTGTKISFAVDSHAPLSTLSVTASTGPNAAGWYAAPVNVALTATDGPGGLGVARSEYTLDGSAWTTFPNAGLTISTDGSHNVCYRSVDKAGNIEAARCVTIAIDTTAPQVTPLFDTLTNTLNLNAQDTVSGISTIETSIDGGTTWNTQTGPVAFTRDGSYAVQYRVRDKAGNLASGQTSVTVATIPNITAPANQTASEGTSQAFNLGSFTDLPGDSPWTVDVDWGDGSVHTAFALTTVGTLGSQSHAYADNGTYTVTVKVTDQAGNAGSKTFQIAAANAAPTATLAAGGPVNEGGSTTLTLNNASDASNADTLAGFRYAFACDGASLAGSTYATASANATASCMFSDSGNRTVRARIIDKDDGFTEYTAVVTVNNVAPIATLNVSAAVNEGSAATIAFGSQSDVSPADVLAGFRYAFACNGASLASATYANSSASATGTCSYADGPGTYPVRARIIDKDDGFTEYTAAVTVNNAAPSVSGVTTPADPVLVNTAVTVSAAFTDAGVFDTHTAVIDWGDGSNSAGSVSEANGSGSVTGSHAYTAAGTYTVTVAVTDKDGGIHSASYQSVVVIDPAGASINGNGRMTSRSGSMPGNPGATGQARLKIKADYKGAGALTGDLSFEFKGGNLDFQSTSYDWLAAFGSKATLKGSGTLNGSGNYGFIVSAGEGNPDVVRVKIWNQATGQVVYDSQPGANDFADPTTPVDNGNISVH